MKCDHHSSVIHAKELLERKILLLPHDTSACIYFTVIALSNKEVFISRFIPVNTLINFFLIIYGLIVGSILMTAEPSFIWLIFLLPILYRFLSYYYVERFSLNES